MSGPAPAHDIKIRVSAVGQLFNSFDPSPFRERDIDVDAETFIVDWAREFPRGSPLRILIELPAADAALPEAQAIPGAIANHFDGLARRAASDLRELFRIGRLSLAIGVLVLAFCLVASQMATTMIPLPGLARIVEESLILLGWVANWRPLELYLYDWWPLVRRRHLYRRIAAAPVEIRTA